jgi:hypothetical protein
MDALRRSHGAPGKRKSEVVTIRLDPKLKYVAELAARKQRRTLSSYIEWAVEESLKAVHPAEGDDFPLSFADEASRLWDVDEPDRFAKLALQYPGLLNHEEQRIWKLVRECGYLWKGKYGGPANQWRWETIERSLISERLREHWPLFCAVARGEQPASALPEWMKTKPADGREDMDDEIPF